MASSIFLVYPPPPPPPLYPPPHHHPPLPPPSLSSLLPLHPSGFLTFIKLFFFIDEIK